jgi:nucleotide-binding universal stress UspA family protein
MMQMLSMVLAPPFLLATDGSPSARSAQQWLQQIAPLWLGTVNSSSIVAITVHPRPRYAQRLRQKRHASKLVELPNLETTSTPNDGDQVRSTLEVDFGAIATVPLEVRQGRPVTEILTYARSLQPGLIAVGHQGTGGVKERLLGNVATVIARYAPCSVLVARGMEGRFPSLKHVLVPVDGTVASSQAIAALKQLIPAGVERATLLYVQPPLNANYLFGPFTSPNPSWQLSKSLQTVQKEQGEQILQQARALLGKSSVQVDDHIHLGEEGVSICQVAEQLRVDFVILGNEGKRRSLPTALPTLRLPKRRSLQALRNARLSATEDYVIHYAPCPVLLCRQTDWAEKQASA